VTVASNVLPGRPNPEAPLRKALREEERRLIREALAKAGGHKGNAADLLGISRKSLWERCRILSLDVA
jgi:transcriptional regulator with PAS, ATPase and Fis domain